MGNPNASIDPEAVDFIVSQSRPNFHLTHFARGVYNSVKLASLLGTSSRET